MSSTCPHTFQVEAGRAGSILKADDRIWWRPGGFAEVTFQQNLSPQRVPLQVAQQQAAVSAARQPLPDPARPGNVNSAVVNSAPVPRFASGEAYQLPAKISDFVNQPGQSLPEA